MLLEEMKKSSLEKDYFADTTAGKIALERMRAASSTELRAPEFRLYEIGWLDVGGPPETWSTMEVKGCSYRVAKSGPRKGLLVMPIPGTHRTVHVTRSEMDVFEAQEAHYKGTAKQKGPKGRSIRVKNPDTGQVETRIMRESGPKTLVEGPADNYLERMNIAYRELTAMIGSWVTDTELTRGEIDHVLALVVTERRRAKAKAKLS